MTLSHEFALGTAIFCFPAVLPSVLAMLARVRLPGRRAKFGFVIRVAAIAYGLAIAAAFFMSLILRTVAPSFVTGTEPLAPFFDFILVHELDMAAAVLVLGSIGASIVLLPKSAGC